MWELSAVFDPSWLILSTVLQLYAKCFWIKIRFVNLWQWGRIQSRKNFAAFSKVNYMRRNQTHQSRFLVIFNLQFFWHRHSHLLSVSSPECPGLELCHWTICEELPQNMNLSTGSAACDFWQMCSAAAALQRLSCWNHRINTNQGAKREDIHWIHLICDRLYGFSGSIWTATSRCENLHSFCLSRRYCRYPKWCRWGGREDSLFRFRL